MTLANWRASGLGWAFGGASVHASDTLRRVDCRSRREPTILMWDESRSQCSLAIQVAVQNKAFYWSRRMALIERIENRPAENRGMLLVYEGNVRRILYSTVLSTSYIVEADMRRPSPSDCGGPSNVVPLDGKKAISSLRSDFGQAIIPLERGNVARAQSNEPTLSMANEIPGLGSPGPTRHG